MVASVLGKADMAGVPGSTGPRFGGLVVRGRVPGDPAGHGAVIADLTHFIRWAGVATVILAIPEPAITLLMMVPAILTSTRSRIKAR